MVHRREPAVVTEPAAGEVDVRDLGRHRLGGDLQGLFLSDDDGGGAECWEHERPSAATAAAPTTRGGHGILVVTAARGGGRLGRRLEHLLGRYGGRHPAVRRSGTPRATCRGNGRGHGRRLVSLAPDRRREDGRRRGAVFAGADVRGDHGEDADAGNATSGDPARRAGRVAPGRRRGGGWSAGSGGRSGSHVTESPGDT